MTRNSHRAKNLLRVMMIYREDLERLQRGEDVRNDLIATFLRDRLAPEERIAFLEERLAYWTATYMRILERG